MKVKGHENRWGIVAQNCSQGSALAHTPAKGGEVSLGVSLLCISETLACMFAFCYLTECHYYGQEQDSKSRDENYLFTEYF